LLSWLAFGTSASAATSRLSSNSRPVYIRYQTAAPAAPVRRDSCQAAQTAAPAAALNHPLLYLLSYNAAAAAAVVEDSLLHHSL